MSRGFFVLMNSTRHLELLELNVSFYKRVRQCLRRVSAACQPTFDCLGDESPGSIGAGLSLESYEFACSKVRPLPLKNCYRGRVAYLSLHRDVYSRLGRLGTCMTSCEPPIDCEADAAINI